MVTGDTPAIAHSPLGGGKPVSVCLLKELPVGSSDDLASEMPSFGFNHVGDWTIMDQSFIVFLLVHSVPALKLTKGCFLANHWACSLPDACVQVLVNMLEGRKWTLVCGRHRILPHTIKNPQVSSGP